MGDFLAVVVEEGLIFVTRGTAATVKGDFLTRGVVCVSSRATEARVGAA